jgi:signal transduction histidine kinase
MDTGEASIRALQQRITLLEQGMKQAAHIREMWRKSSDELQATKAELSESLAQLTTAHEELGRKTDALELANTKLKEEIALRERMEAELRLAQKLESIGQLAAGIAHEINTPIQFIGDNTLYLSEAFDSFVALFNQLQPLADQATDPSAAIAEAVDMIRSGDLADLAAEVPEAITETLDGIEQVATIINSMKEFSHMGSQKKSTVDINHALETTATVARGEWKHIAKIEWQLDEQLPVIDAVAAELNQVFLNLLINAAHAVAAARGASSDGLGLIRIATTVENDGIMVRITDNGIGIPDDVKEHIFDPFFTTKDVGEGSGQGLSVARSIVVNHHHGKIDAESVSGVGTTLSVWLPIS